MTLGHSYKHLGLCRPVYPPPTPPPPLKFVWSNRHGKKKCNLRREKEANPDINKQSVALTDRGKFDILKGGGGGGEKEMPMSAGPTEVERRL